MNPDLILWPTAGHIGLVVALYVWLTVLRQRALRSGAAQYADFRLSREEPEDCARVARNIANQFELPVLYYALVALLIATGAVTSLQVVLAWIFLLGRIAHAGVQVFTADVRLRGMVFTVNFLALLAMWALFLSERLFWSGR